MTATITELLARASEIGKKHEMIAEMTGERFNIFSILDLQANETRTHSAILRELLDPRGSHGLRDTFLKAFVAMLAKVHGTMAHGEPIEWDDDARLAAKVSTEVGVGCKSDDCSEGGRIDLVIAPGDRRRKILIENKIYAGEQECQLLRYHNYDRSALLIYLTLEGNLATEFSTKNLATRQELKLGEDYFLLSYKVDILHWLEECRKEAASHPLVRETIAQYMNLIRHLTQQNTTNIMSEEIATAVLRDKETFDAFWALRGAEQIIKEKILAHLENRLLDIGNRLGLECKIELSAEGKKYSACVFTTVAMKSRNLQILYTNHENQFRDWQFGFCRINQKDETLPNPIDLGRLKEAFVDKFGKCEESFGWPAYSKEHFYQLWTDVTFAAIYYGTFIEEFSKLLKKHVDVAKEAGLA
jgi:hypothetical protein